MRREHRAQRDVAEHVERADVLREPVRRARAASVRSRRRVAGQRGDDALHPHEARALDQHRRAARAASRATRATSASTSAKCARARAERAAPRRGVSVAQRRTAGRRRPRARTRRPRDGTPAPARRLRPCRPAPASVGRGAAASTSIAARTESGIGVVACRRSRVAPCGARARCSRPATGAKRARARARSPRSGDAGRERRGGRGQRIAHVVPARHARARTVRVALRRAQRELAAVGAQRAARRVTVGGVRRAPKSTTRTPARARGCAPDVGVRVVGVDHRDAAGAQRAR